MQLPLPKHIDTDAILERIDPAKDADGLHPTNLGRLVLNVNGPITSPLPCTPRGVIELLRAQRLDLAGKHVVVVGRGVTIGRSIGPAADPPGRERHRDADAHRHREPARQLLRQADVIVAAAGAKHIVKAADVKPGAAVLDVGVTRETDPETGKSKVHRRRRSRRRRGRRLDLAEPRRRRSHDRGAAHDQRGRSRGTPIGSGKHAPASA